MKVSNLKELALVEQTLTEFCVKLLNTCIILDKDPVCMSSLDDLAETNLSKVQIEFINSVILDSLNAPITEMIKTKDIDNGN